MNEEDLSPEARQRLEELTPAIHAVENWNFAYLDMLKGLAEEELPDLADVEIKGQGMEALKRSRKEHAVAVELKSYAVAFLGPDNSAELAKLPETASLDDFLERVMPNTGKQVRRDRFMRFLIAEAESQVDEQMELHPKPGVSREKYARRMAEWDFSLYDKEGLQRPSQYWRGQAFRKWWKSQSDGNPLGKHNYSKSMSVANRHKALIVLLPSRPNEPGITKEKWMGKAEKAGLLESLRTFRRDVQRLTDSKMIHVQENGSFRQLPKNA